MTTEDHGKCVHCGFDLNGEFIYDYFLKWYGGDWQKAQADASMYGAGPGWGRFGKEIYMKGYDSNYNKLEPYFQCPECGEKCYEEVD
jgi:hypothetical protein